MIKDKKDKRVIQRNTFQIIPKFGEADIEIKESRTFLTGEKMTMDFILPKSMKHEDFKLSYALIKKGGFLPGCARVIDFVFDGKIFKKGLKSDTIRAPAPGHYLVQFFAMPGYTGSSLNHPFLLAEVSFTTDVNWDPDGLSFSSGKDEFVYGENIPVTINTRVDLGLEKMGEDNEHYNLAIYRQGDVNYGGSYRLEKYVYIPSNILVINKVILNDNTIRVKGNDQIVIDVKKMEDRLPPGAYELRLHTDYNGFLVSMLPFKVTEPDSPFSWEGGNPSFPRPSDIKSPWLISGLNFGEYLDANTCGNAILETTDEKMQIKFVSFENGAYVDVTEPIDFGAGFYVQGQLEEEATRESYFVTLTTPEGDQQEVALFPLEEDATVVRSDRVYLIWHPEEGGAGE